VCVFGQNISFKQITTDNGLSNNKIHDIIQDNTGFIWLATDDGLNRFDGYNFKVFCNKTNDKSSLSNNSVWALYEDQSGFIWIGTKSRELNWYDPNTDKFTSWEIKSEVVKKNSIKSIYEDSRGAIWIGTYKSGLYHFDPVTEKIENWRNDPNNNSSFFTNYIRYNTDDEESKTIIEKGISEIDSIILKYKDNIVTIDFATLSFYNNFENQYRYLLEGFNENWIQLGNKHTITFTILSPGDYKLRVIGSNIDNIWNEPGKTLFIQVQPGING